MDLAHLGRRASMRSPGRFVQNAVRIGVGVRESRMNARSGTAGRSVLSREKVAFPSRSDLLRSARTRDHLTR